MTSQIDIEIRDRNIPFMLDWTEQSWKSLEELEESDFPLIAVVDNKRYTLYLDKTFAELEE